MKRMISYFGCVVICLALCGQASAARIYVDVDATGANNGTSWQDAYTSLSNALSNASSGDEVWVAEGTYSPIMLVDNVKVYGGFSGNETSASQSNPDAYITTIDADGQSRAVMSEDDNWWTILRGFRIINGSTSNHGEGAGVYLNNSSPTFVRCVFKDNASDHLGGAVANIGDGSPRFVNCKFYHNTATYAGGAVLNKGGSPNFHNCLFYENTAGEAGAVASMSGVCTFIQCTIADNTALVGNGGAMYDYAGIAVVRNSILWNNDSVNYNSDEIFNARGTTTVTYSNVKGGWSGTGNINADPKFKNPGADNYKLGGTLLSPSPCKDAGNDPYIPHDFGDLDWDSNTGEDLPYDLTASVYRIMGDHVDMGAYEVVTGFIPGGS